MFYLILSNLILFLLASFLVKFKKKELLKFFEKSKEAHNYNENILPIGGILLFFYLVFNFNYLSSYQIIAYFLLVFLGFCSDIKLIKSPSIRFLIMLILIGIFINYLDLSIATNNFPLFKQIMKNEIFNYFFTLFCILIVVNGCNFIDGVNNNLNFFFILFNLTIMFIKYSYQIDFSFNAILLIFLIIFSFFNYKNQLMYGDAGAYLIGFLCAIEIILLTNQVQSLSKYFAIVLLAYPSYEVLFSVIRKRKKNSFFPDGKHLHLLLINHNKKNHLKSSLQINLVNFLLFSIAALYNNDDAVLIFLIFSYIIIYNIVHQNLNR